MHHFSSVNYQNAVLCVYMLGGGEMRLLEYA